MQPNPLRMDDIERNPLNLEDSAKVLPSIQWPLCLASATPSQTVQALKPSRKKKFSVAFPPEESKELRAVDGPLGRALSQIDGLDQPLETQDMQPKKKTRTLNPVDTMSPEAEKEALVDLSRLLTNLYRDTSEAQRLCYLRKFLAQPA
jgi:hypothetical protein